MNIPIANAFRLLAYAWDVAEEAEDRTVGTEALLAPIDFLGHTLAGATADLIRRGIRREYIEIDDIVPGIRGKLLIGPTIQRNLLASARTVCRVAELREDTRANRLIRATVHTVLRARGLDPDVRGRLDEVDSRLSTIPLVRPRTADFQRIQIHRNNRLYRLILWICRLIHDRLIVDEDGTTGFRDFRREKRFMWRIFERFVRRFYEREQTRYHVSAPKIEWVDLVPYQSDLQRIPEMRTDIVLRTPDRFLVIDTKFYDSPLATGRFGQPTIRSAHLYQLLTYVAQLQRSRLWHGQTIDGMLLYPAVEEPFDFRYSLGGVGIRAVTLDLSQAWPSIRTDLLDMLEPWRGA